MSKKTKEALKKLEKEQAPLREELALKVEAGDEEAAAQLYQLDKELLAAQAEDGNKEAETLLGELLAAEAKALEDAEAAKQGATPGEEGDKASETEDKNKQSDETDKKGDQDTDKNEDEPKEESGLPSADIIVKTIEDYVQLMAQNRNDARQCGGLARRYFSVVKSACTSEYDVPQKELIQLILDQAHKGRLSAFAPKNRTKFISYMNLHRGEQRGYIMLMACIADLSDPETRQSKASSIDWEVLADALPRDIGEAVVAAFRGALNVK